MDINAFLFENSTMSPDPSLKVSGSGPSKSSPLDSVNANGEGEKKIAVADFKGKFLVIIFFKNNDSKEFLKAFSDLADLFRGNKIEVEAISKKILVD